MTRAHVGHQRALRPVLFLLDWLFYSFSVPIRLVAGLASSKPTAAWQKYATLQLQIKQVSEERHKYLKHHYCEEQIWPFPKSGFICFCNLSKG